MNWEPIIQFFLSISVLGAVFTYLLKVGIERFADSRVLKYQNELGKETELFKHELSRMTIEHQIKYSKLYEERGDVIKKMNSLLLELEAALSELTTIFQGPDWIEVSEKDENAKKCIYIVRNELEINRIFFSEELCEKIESILLESHKIAVDMWKVKREEQANIRKINRGVDVPYDPQNDPSVKWEQLDEKVKNSFRVTRIKLANEFRQLIGVK